MRASALRVHFRSGGLLEGRYCRGVPTPFMTIHAWWARVFRDADGVRAVSRLASNAGTTSRRTPPAPPRQWRGGYTRGLRSTPRKLILSQRLILIGASRGAVQGARQRGALRAAAATILPRWGSRERRAGISCSAVRHDLCDAINASRQTRLSTGSRPRQFFRRRAGWQMACNPAG